MKLSDSWAAHFDRFKIAVETAEFFDAPLIRVFSYYPAEGTTHAELIAQGRDEVVRRMQASVDYLAGHAPVLVHENEHHIFGEKGAQCAELHRAIPSLKLRAAFDFANFVLDGEDPWVNWPLLKAQTAHIHVKDARRADRKVVPAGAGDGRIADILKDAHANGYDGFLSLEPHLAAAGQLSGFSGPELFRTTVDALKQVCRDNNLPLASGNGA